MFCDVWGIYDLTHHCFYISFSVFLDFPATYTVGTKHQNEIGNEVNQLKNDSLLLKSPTLTSMNAASWLPMSR